MSPAVATDLDRKVDLQFSDFEKLQLPERKFAYALWKEGLFRVSDKQRLLNSVYDSLKPGGGLVITDFVTPKRGYTSPEVQDWLCSEPVAPTLWSAEETLEVLNSLKFRVPIHEDISMEYQRIVIDAWKRWLVLLPRLQEEGKLDAQFRSALMSQLTYWVHRANLIETGELRLFRYFALKPEDSLASLG
jgi:SAM-dependent methyltransferase